ncbi:Egl nine-like 3 isoform x1, partial [Globisporangium polare]
MVTCSSCGDEGGSQVGLPAVGTCGWRCLDDLAFACRVVAHDADGTTLSVQYADDQQVESGLHSDEFLLREPGIRAQASSLQQSEHEYGDINIHHDDYFRRLYGLVDVSQGGSASDSVVNYVASFLDHLQWMQRLALVSKRWRRALIQQQSWEILRLPQEIVCRSGAWLGTARYDAAIRNLLLQPATLRGDGDPNANTSLEPRAKVYQVVQELVFDGCPVTDALVLEFVAQCQQLKRLSLRRCSQISFLLLYELTRLTKEKESKKCERFRLQHVDVWLCRGISPAYVDQLRCNGVFTRTGLNVTGPGFFILEVSASTEQWIKRSGAEVLPLLPEDFQQQYRQEPHIEVDFQSLSVCFVSKARLRALFKETHQAARELRNLRDRVDDMPLTMIPLVCCFESVVRRSGELGTEQDTSQYSLVGIPSTPDDLVQFVAQYEERYVQSQLSSALASIVESREEWSAGVADSEDKATKLYSPEQDESLD